MRRGRDGKWVRQHIPKAKNNMLNSPVHPLSGMRGRCNAVFRPAKVTVFFN